MVRIKLAIKPRHEYIRMYNCYFGDCFRITTSNGNDLMVDFGIHDKQGVKKGDRKKRFNEIYLDNKDNRIDFLLSHYHADHYNGIMYMKGLSYTFNDVYIPDIWSFNCSINLIVLSLLEEILNKGFIGDRENRENLYFFLSSICKSNICFVQRGTTIQNKYIALWPSQEYINEKANIIMKEIKKDSHISEEYLSFLFDRARELKEIVSAMSEPGDKERLMSRLEYSEMQVAEWSQHLQLEGLESNIAYDLSGFKNDISIVFQNIKSNNDNILFTGDFGEAAGLWDLIETNRVPGSSIPMHANYHIIKVGHHGTKSFYHSFVGRINQESILLIPNGASKDSWGICSNYSLNALTTGAKILCSTDRTCEARKNNNGNCTCSNFKIIEKTSSFYYDVN